ncbi:MAG TPA: type I-U CRISPR-associated protein Cas7 [Clostridia bacterium]|nr:type I-U CRISPR-associated protein Cas7 [Clostridia bacterium]
MNSLELKRLKSAVAGEAAAIRIVTRLEPVGHPRDKVFPPTYAGGEYATEKRYSVEATKGDGAQTDENAPVDAVLLHSVAGEANLMEEALKAAIREGRLGVGEQRLEIPLLQVSFAGTVAADYIPEPITVLDAPHRVFDAIFRDSEVAAKNGNGTTVFKDTPAGQAIAKASSANATPLYEWSPTSLIFGCWNSANDKVPGKIKGNLKIPRTIVSEIVGFHTVVGKKVGGKIDPLGITRQPIYEDGNGNWTPLQSAAKKDDGGNPMKFRVKNKAKGIPSEILHGNIAPSIGGTGDEGSPNGGVTMKYAQQTTVLSLSALRRLRFPVNGQQNTQRDLAARTVLAALGLVAITAQRERDYFLRSRCELRAVDTPPFEFVVQGRPLCEHDQFSLTFEEAVKLLEQAIAEAKDLMDKDGNPIGVAWKSASDLPSLSPKANLAELIRLSHEQGGAEDEEQDQSAGIE